MIVLWLFVVGSTAVPFGIGFGRSFGFPQNPQMFGPQDSNFLNMVGDHARSEYVDLYEDEDLPRSEFREKAKEWAKKHGVEDEHEKFAKDMEESKEDAKRQMDQFVKELPEALGKFRDIFENENLTKREIRKEKHALEDELSAPTQQVLMFAMRFLGSRRFSPQPPMLGGGFEGFRRPQQGFHPLAFHHPFFSGPEPSHLSQPSFEQEGSPDDQEGYEKIMEFEDIPRQEVERKMEEWAENHEDSSEATDDLENYEEFKKNQSEDIQKTLDNLKPAFEKYATLFANESLPMKELHKETRRIFEDLSLQEAMVAQHILQIFQPKPSSQSRFPRSEAEGPIFHQKTEISEPPMNSMEQMGPIFPQNPRHESKSTRDSDEDYSFQPKHRKEQNGKTNQKNFFFRF